MDKWLCDVCGAISTDKELLRAKNPFDDIEDIAGCPNCRSIDCFRHVCDIKDCKEESTCGFPSDNGYLRTCGKHYSQYSK